MTLGKVKALQSHADHAARPALAKGLQMHCLVAYAQLLGSAGESGYAIHMQACKDRATTMNPNFASLPAQTLGRKAGIAGSTPGKAKRGGDGVRASRLHPRLTAYAAFFLVVFACMAAAAAVAGTDMPLLVVGL